LEIPLIEIVNQTTQKTFTLASASELLPLIYRLTEETDKGVKDLATSLNVIIDKKSDHALKLQEQIDQLVTRWHSKLERLGVRPKGVWLADFDNGTGYFCWKFPETKIMFYHGYQDGFSGRRKVDEKFDSIAIKDNVILFHDKLDCNGKSMISSVHTTKSSEKGYLTDASSPSPN
jgi:hypothetical protein